MILWFSGTGNSRYVAEKIAKETGDKLFSINNSMKMDEPYNGNDENLVVVVPTYAWRIPKIVDKWLRNSNFEGAKRIWFVMTCGGDIGGAAKYNRQTSIDMGLEYMGTMEIVLPDNYIIMFKPESEETSKRLFTEAEPKIADAIEKLKAGKPFIDPKAGFYKKFMSTAINPGFNWSLKIAGYHTDDKCIGCMKCVDKCPLNNIKFANGKPEWGNNCTQCMACISYCPTNAIEYKNKTNGKDRHTAEKYW